MQLYRILAQDEEGNIKAVTPQEEAPGLPMPGATIPADPGNRDYQAFLAWCTEGNTPDPVE